MKGGVIHNHNMAVIKQRTQHLRKPRVEGNRIATASKKQRNSETALKSGGNQRRPISMTWHFSFNTNASRGISVLTKIGLSETRFIKVNRRFAVRLGLSLKCQKVFLAFYRTLFCVGLRLFFRVIFSFFKAYQIPCLDTPKWAARSVCVASGKSATCSLSAS